MNNFSFVFKGIDLIFDLPVFMISCCSWLAADHFGASLPFSHLGFQRMLSVWKMSFKVPFFCVAR